MITIAWNWYDGFWYVAADLNDVDPLKDYLNRGCGTWDGELRADTFLEVYCGANVDHKPLVLKGDGVSRSPNQAVAYALEDLAAKLRGDK